MRKRSAALFLLACAVYGASEADKSWNNLGHTIKESNYTIVTREGRCVTAHIEAFDETSVTVKSLRLDRKDVLRIGDDTSIADHDPLYSGRSSWSDLQHAEPNKYERIRLDLKVGTSRTCHNFRAANKDATCDDMQIEKAEVVRGYYVRFAPATEWEHHVMREDVPFLAPRTWFNFAFFPRITVLLYDAAVPEENFKVECKVPVASLAAK